MKLVQLTRRGYQPLFDARVWINPAQVVWVAASGVIHSGKVETWSTVQGNGFCFDVEEAPEVVISHLESAGVA